MIVQVTTKLTEGQLMLLKLIHDYVEQETAILRPSTWFMGYERGTYKDLAINRADITFLLEEGLLKGSFDPIFTSEFSVRLTRLGERVIKGAQ